MSFLARLRPGLDYVRAVATVINPDTLAPPRGYSNGLVLTGGRVLFIAGQIGWDAEMRFPTDELTGQFALALDNVRMGKHFPAMALVEVKGLLEDRAQVEIEATAVLP